MDFVLIRNTLRMAFSFDKFNTSNIIFYEMNIL